MVRIERGAHTRHEYREPTRELIGMQPAAILDVLRPHEVAQRDDRLHVQLAQAQDDGAIVIENLGIEFAGSRLDARPRDREAQCAAAQSMRVQHILFPAIPEVGGAPARHNAFAPLPQVPDVGREAGVERLGLVIGDRYAEQEGLR